MSDGWGPGFSSRPIKGCSRWRRATRRSTDTDVLPWGGRDGRLATNPIAYAVPTGGDPVVADFSTSVAPEGKIRFYRNEGKTVPDGWILDADGNATNDPNAFYGPPRGGFFR